MGIYFVCKDFNLYYLYFVFAFVYCAVRIVDVSCCQNDEIYLYYQVITLVLVFAAGVYQQLILWPLA